MILYSLLLRFYLLQLPGGKLMTDGLLQISKSDSQLINLILVLIVLAMCLFSFFFFKYITKKHGEELILQNTKNKEENAINVGAQQLIIKGKDEVIAAKTLENEYLKEKSEELKANMIMVLRDNIQASKDLVAKIGQHSDISVSILSTINTNHENMKLFLVTDVLSKIKVS